MKDFWIKWRREIVRGGFLFLLVVGFGLVAFNFVRRLRDRVTGFASQIATNLPAALRNLNLEYNGNFDDAGRTHGDPWTWTGKLVAGQTLKIENVNGPIVVTPAKLGEALVATEKSWNHSDSASVRLMAVETPSGVTICAVWPNSNGDCGRSGQGLRTHVGQRHGGGGNDVAVKFTVQVPRGVKLDATTVNGDVNITSPGAVNATTVSGDMTVDAGAWPVKLITVAGDMNATVRAVGTDSASITSVSGDVTLFLPKSASLTVDGNTVSGDIETGFPLTVITPQYGPGHSVHGSVGGGAGRLKLTTVSGDIAVQPIGASVRIGHRTPKPAAAPAPAVAPQPR